MIHKRKNLSNTALARYLKDNSVKDGDEFRNCNLSRLKRVEIFKGVKNLKFVECNLVNCILPDDAVTEHCNTVQKSFCTHVLDAKGVHHDLTKCAVDCEHLMETDTIEIDGKAIDTVRHYKHKIIKDVGGLGGTE